MMFDIVKGQNRFISYFALSFVPVIVWMTSVLLKKKNPTVIRQDNSKTLLLPLIVITGCDTGLGYSIVMRYLNDEKHSEIFNYKKLFAPRKIGIIAFCLNPEGLGANSLIKQSFKSNRVKLFIRQLDLTDTHSIKSGVTFINDTLTQNVDENGIPNKTGRFKYELHALINNAALMIMAEFEWQTPQMIKKQFEVNVLGPIMLTTELTPLFRKHKSRVINIISHCAYMPLPGISIYGSTKAALNAWTLASRIELETYGVRMITFLPGSFYLHSSIMNGQQRTIDYNAIRENMSNEQLTYYGSYLDEYQSYLNKIDAYISNPTKTIPSSNKIYHQMDNALWAIHPKTEYNVPQPWRYKIYFIMARTLSLFRLHNFKDEVIRQFVATPRFKNN